MPENESAFAVVLDGRGIGGADAGGKGAALDRLVALGSPVPRSGVLTTAAYRAFVAQHAMAGAVHEWRTGRVPPPGRHEDERRAVDDAFLAAPMPPEVAAAIDVLALAVGGDGAVAVRSSATAEDLHSASFAGQYRSFLGVGRAELEHAVRLTWASLWHPSPRAYRRFHGIDEQALAMAVIVMRMLTPDRAGVLFTVDPAGAADSLRIETVLGLGEQLVSGAVTPEVLVLPRATAVAALDAMDPLLGELALRALDLEVALGAPQDLEWAIEPGRLWLLQARPITTRAGEAHDSFDVGFPGDPLLTSGGIAEMLPGVLPPRLWELDSALVEEAFRSLLDDLGANSPGLREPHALLARVRGRVAMNLDALREAAASIPGGSPEEIEREYAGGAVDGLHASEAPSSTAERSPRRTGVSQGLRTLRSRAGAAQESETVILAVDATLDALAELDLGGCSDDELLALGARARDLAVRAMSAELAIAAMATASYRAVELLLAKHIGTTDAARHAQQLTGRGRALRAAIMVALDPVVAIAGATPSLAEAITSTDQADAREVIGALAGGDALLAAFDRAVRRAGSTAVPGGETWAEVPHLAWAMVQRSVERAAALATADPDEGAARVAAGRAELERRIVRDPRWRASRHRFGHVVDVQRAFLRREADDATALLERRERTKAAVMMIGGVLRRIDLEVAERLVAVGALEDRHDIELVTNDESATMLRSVRELGTAHRGPSLAEIGQRRHRGQAELFDGPLPRLFRGTPPPAPRVAIGDTVRGWGAAPGRYEGPVCVADDATSAVMRRGDVLVAHSTDASWAPLFLAAGAIVVEEGGPLSHAAIVARELGVPAVVNVPGLVDRLRQEPDEVTVTVDGTTGDVTVHTARPRADLAGVVPVRAPAAAPDLRRDATRCNVFVTGLIGAGAMVSVAIAMTEAVGSRRGRARLRRRAAPVAASIAHSVVHGADATGASPVGLRSRRWFTEAAAVLTVATCLLAVRAGADLDGATLSGGSSTWWALNVLSATTCLALAAVLGSSAVRWPAVRPGVRRFVLDHPARARSTADLLGARWFAVFAALLGVVAALGVLHRVGVDALDRVDRRLYEGMHAGGGADRWGPDWLNVVGQPHGVVVLAALLTLLLLRCRVLAVAFPAMVAVAGASLWFINHLVGRERPPLSAHAGESNSYPGGHVLQVTILFAVVPIALHVATRRRWAGHLAAALTLVVYVVLQSDTIRTGGHWPSDQVGGIALGLALMVVLGALVRTPDLHADCHGCPYRPR